jgi:orotate phosphoribosyltransferase
MLSTNLQLQFMSLFLQVGAVREGHFVYAKKANGWHHGKEYFDKDVISMYPWLVKLGAQSIIMQLLEQGLLFQIEAVVAPAVGAIAWGQSLISELPAGNAHPRPLFMFAEKGEHPTDKNDHIFKFRPLFEGQLKGKKVLITEDIANPGTSAMKVAKAVEACGGQVLAIAVICNRQGQKSHDYLAPYPLIAVTETVMVMHHEDNCPFCEQGKPIDLSVGKAKTWLAESEKGKAWTGGTR